MSMHPGGCTKNLSDTPRTSPDRSRALARRHDSSELAGLKLAGHKLTGHKLTGRRSRVRSGLGTIATDRDRIGVASRLEATTATATATTHSGSTRTTATTGTTRSAATTATTVTTTATTTIATTFLAAALGLAVADVVRGGD